jgi:Kelch motif protein
VGIFVAAIGGTTLALLAFEVLREPPPAASPAGSGAAASASTGVARWTMAPAAPVGLTEVAATEYAGQIWVAGGLTADGQASDRVFVFDLGDQTWTEGRRLPQPVHHASLVSNGNSAWLIGGYVGNGFDRPTDAVWSLTAGEGWAEQARLPEARAAGAAALSNAGMLVYGGGVGPNGVSDAVFVQEDGGRWREFARLSQPREHLAATSDGDGHVFFLGGRRGGLGGNLAVVDIADLISIRHLGELPTPRGGVAAFWWPSLGACLVGGESPTGTNAQVECITGDGRVIELPELRVPRHGLGAAVVNSRAYVLLGGRQPGLFVSDVVESLELP